MRHVVLIILALAFAGACSKAPKTAAPTLHSAHAEGFATPRQAADALIGPASAADLSGVLAILGPEGRDLVVSADPVEDKQRAAAFVTKAHEKNQVVVHADDPTRATLVVGAGEWPLPIPLVKRDGKWYFDSAAGRHEVLARRIGANELDVLDVCHGYVAAQREYASKIHDDLGVHQYARRIVSTPGKHDGLAWQNPDGTWGGPVGAAVARALEQGYAEKQPFHGYYFEILEGQGPSARLGALDYMVDGAMLGGFALVAWPAEYGATGIQTFIVSYDGIVYQKDLGPATASIASSMERYDPDPSWRRTDDTW